MEIRIYFEGNRALRPGFEHLFSDLRIAAREADSEIQFVAAKSGPHDYRKAARTHPHAWNVLLKDSEEQIPASPAELCRKLGIDPTLEASVFWMVELMESWFLADPNALVDYYGQGFSASTIGATQDVERIPKSDVLLRLKQASKNTSKGEYHKVKHAPHILERLNPDRVQKHASHCRKLFDAVKAKL
jgi:hypothetical protein